MYEPSSSTTDASSDPWGAAMERGFRDAGDGTFVGRLGDSLCSIAMVPVIYGYLGVLVTVSVAPPLRGTLFWRRGRVAGSIFSGGLAPDVSDPAFAAEYRILTDGAAWSLTEASCHLVHTLRLEYLQALPASLSVLWMSEAPPDEATLTRIEALMATLIRAHR